MVNNELNSQYGHGRPVFFALPYLGLNDTMVLVLVIGKAITRLHVGNTFARSGKLERGRFQHKQPTC